MKQLCTFALLLILLSSCESTFIQSKPPNVLADGASLSNSDKSDMDPDILHKYKTQEQLTSDDIIALTNQGLDPAQIIHMIQETGSTYCLSPGDIARLKKQNVDYKVINYMKRSCPNDDDD